MPALAGLRVLVVEDELLIATTIEQALERAECTVIGPVPRVAKAVDVARSAAIDVGLLDVNLAGEEVFPVADVLAQRTIPFVFLTGYAPSIVPPSYGHHAILGKPCSLAKLYRTLATAVGR